MLTGTWAMVGLSACWLPNTAMWFGRRWWDRVRARREEERRMREMRRARARLTWQKCPTCQGGRFAEAHDDRRCAACRRRKRTT